ncbi:hypothetical protein B7H20_00460 [Pseudomonas aeruginosa]|nr:hypothetical protein B7H20_00460 [Pseudomonas aeruginosa]QII98453.1 hypothetical protein F9C43_34585 [Pseudomonas aeruginosa]
MVARDIKMTWAAEAALFSEANRSQNMPMLAPWSDHEQPDGSIQVRFNDQHRFTLNWVQERGQWELRRTGQDEVIETDQYRNDLFSAIQSGRIT